VETHLSGIYPRSEKLVAATRAAVRGDLSQDRVEGILDEDTKSLILLERESSLDSFVDGQLNWQDLFRPFSEILHGIKATTLTRWFDNNTFYRKPIIDGKVTFEGEGFQKYFRADLLPQDGRKKAILPGPLTFALMSENKTYQSLGDLVGDIAKALRDTVRKLESLGYSRFQFDEPAILSPDRTKSELETAKKAYETCAHGTALLQTYFGDASPVIDTLLDFPVDAIGIDLYSTRLEALRGHDFDKTLGCGCVDGRNSLLETPEYLRTIVLNVRNQFHPRDIYLTPNCAFEFLPRTVADSKVRLLGETARLLE